MFTFENEHSIYLLLVLFSISLDNFSLTFIPLMLMPTIKNGFFSLFTFSKNFKEKLVN